MSRATKLAATTALLIGLGLGLAACAGPSDGYLADGAYPYDGAYDDGTGASATKPASPAWPSVTSTST